MVRIEAVGHQVQLTTILLGGQLEARHRGDAVLFQRRREAGGALDRIVVGQGRVADTAGCQAGRQHLGRLLAVAEDGVGVEVDVTARHRGRAPRRRVDRHPRAQDLPARHCGPGGRRVAPSWQAYAVAGTRFGVRSETTINVMKLNGMETMPGLVSGNGASSGSRP